MSAGPDYEGVPEYVAELKRLNALCVGKTVARITYEEAGPDTAEIYFTDDTVVVLSFEPLRVWSKPP